MKAPVILSLLWIAAFAAISLVGCPLLLRSGNPTLTLLAFVVPCLWVLASVLLYVAWADTGWREEWERPLPTTNHRLAGTQSPLSFEATTMHRIALLLAVILLSACDLRPPRGTEAGTQNLLRFHDDQLAVTCWQVKNWDGIYCIADAQLEPPGEASNERQKNRHPRGATEILSRYAGDTPTTPAPGRLQL